MSIRQSLIALPKSASSLLFASCPVAGAALLVLCFLLPQAATAGLVAVVGSLALASLFSGQARWQDFPQYVVNPLLSGMVVGTCLPLSAPMLAAAFAAGCLAFLLTYLLSNFLHHWFGLPVLSLPFSLVAPLVMLAVSSQTSFTHIGLPAYLFHSLTPTLPPWLSGYFSALGMVVFLPHVLPGLLLALLVFFHSRLLFLNSFLGYVSGCVISAVLQGSFQNIWSDPFAFNFALAGAWLGSIISIASPKSYALAITGAAVTAVVQTGLANLLGLWHLPVFALPFNLTCLVFLYCLRQVGFSHLSFAPHATPETALDQFLTWSQRFSGTYRSLFLPFAGRWDVWQGFNGPWTHQGPHAHAYDFVVKQDGKTHQGIGRDLKDYFAFGKNVLSPVCGRVVKCVNDFPDLPIGQVDHEHPWGNYVVLWDERGFYVTLAHLLQHSLAVQEGQWLQVGDYLGKCGNSGYSPQPHIHLQVQVALLPTSQTLPFNFVSYQQEGDFRPSGLPTVGTVVEGLFEDRSLAAKTSFMLEDQYFFEVQEDDESKDLLSLTVRSTEEGLFYFDSGKARLYFGKQDGRLVFYRMEGTDPYLNAMFMALPSLPLTWRHGLAWEDALPLKNIFQGTLGNVLTFGASFFPNLGKVKSQLHFSAMNVVEGSLKSNLWFSELKVRVTLNEHCGFDRMEIGNLCLRRIPLKKVRG